MSWISVSSNLACQVKGSISAMKIQKTPTSSLLVSRTPFDAPLNDCVLLASVIEPLTRQAGLVLGSLTGGYTLRAPLQGIRRHDRPLQSFLRYVRHPCMLPDLSLWVHRCNSLSSSHPCHPHVNTVRYSTQTFFIPYVEWRFGLLPIRTSTGYHLLAI